MHETQVSPLTTSATHVSPEVSEDSPRTSGSLQSWFQDGDLVRVYQVGLLIAAPNDSNDVLPSLLGRNVINNWRIEYDPSEGRLECTVRRADRTVGAR